jgi:hypothetical protein
VILAVVDDTLWRSECVWWVPKRAERRFDSIHCKHCSILKVSMRNADALRQQQRAETDDALIT